MKSIWYFVGIVLFAMGVVIFATGIYMLIFNQAEKTALSYLHPDIWWGGFMIIIGLVFFITNRKKMH